MVVAGTAAVVGVVALAADPWVQKSLHLAESEADAAIDVRDSAPSAP